MTDDRTSNTGHITTNEADTGLLDGIELFFRLAEEFIDRFDRLLKCSKFTHGIGDLSSPERIETFVETCNAFLGGDFGPSFTQVGGVRRHGGLHTDLDGFEGTEQDIGEEFGGGGCTEEDESTIHVWCEIVAVDMLEDFVETVFSQTLEGVADECWRPAEENTAETTFGAVDGFPAFEVGFVDGVVDLAATFDEIEGGHGSVGWTASDDAAEHAGGEVFGCVGFDFAEGVGAGGGCEGGRFEG